MLEPWISEDHQNFLMRSTDISTAPSIFEATNNENIVDEYTFGQMQDSDTALSVLTQHWDTVGFLKPHDDIVTFLSSGSQKMIS